MQFEFRDRDLSASRPTYISRDVSLRIAPLIVSRDYAQEKY